LRNENLIEVLKRSGDFSKNYGPWLGALLLWIAMKSARPRSIWWTWAGGRCRSGLHNVAAEPNIPVELSLGAVMRTLLATLCIVMGATQARADDLIRNADKLPAFNVLCYRVIITNFADDMPGQIVMGKADDHARFTSTP
jgi:hypothetical protein